MMNEQIEAKALEEFPGPYNGHLIARAAFIKGCQYAANPSAVSREDAGREGLADDIRLHFAKGTAAIYTEYAGETTKALTALKEIALGLLSTPADPGSQVEAGKFAEWAALNGWTYNKIWEAWHNADALPSKIVPTADLITLYKQSL